MTRVMVVQEWREMQISSAEKLVDMIIVVEENKRLNDAVNYE